MGEEAVEKWPGTLQDSEGAEAEVATSPSLLSPRRSASPLDTRVQDNIVDRPEASQTDHIDLDMPPPKRRRLVDADADADADTSPLLLPIDSVSQAGTSSGTSSTSTPASRDLVSWNLPPTKKLVGLNHSVAFNLSEDSLDAVSLDRLQWSATRDAFPELAHENCPAGHLYHELYDRKKMIVRMVDQCMFFNGELLFAREPAVERALREVSGLLSPKYTSYFLLRYTPVAVSFVSKMGGRALERADLHTGVWHAAHWSFLSKFTAQRQADLAGLPFLPGLITVGEQWYFVLTTRSGRKTTLWSRRFIGATTDLMGTYQSIRTVQYLAWWAENVYRAWFKRTILGIQDD
ncbi:hypothetical protein CMUS01_15676 [Colletotrichum musicola]|uniref:PD-(D/E)XK nuclease-like domain-containing protein n=1 Tax=Colletotrichum musicola TaxID=2175873 RepID=A0A8H6MMF5_9PEZI|nr:hypothetical protein CMUS01_15676 [Colletotrichum musicola]